MNAKRKKTRWWLTGLAGIIVVILVSSILLRRLEGDRPAVVLKNFSDSVGVSYRFSGLVTDMKSGIRKIWIGIIKDGKEIGLYKKDFPSKGLLKGGEVYTDSFKVFIEPKKLGISDGKAVLRMVARDYSWRGWGHGNQTYLEKNIIIDTKPPYVEILSRAHNISRGGSGLVVYKLSEDCAKSGVFVGDGFFPGHAGYFKDQSIYMAFIALQYNQGPGTSLFLEAVDHAGNSTRARFPYYIKKRKFKKDTIRISERFLNWKMPELIAGIVDTSGDTMIEKFLKVNRMLRKVNSRKAFDFGKKSEPVLHWKGKFSRLPGSATKATFADHRTYKYKGQVVDHQVHLGVDLASIANSPVQASNNGKVIFAGSLGIYGQTILIDHGFGLLSMYSHLNSMTVQPGQVVSKGAKIGNTGLTGLAGGDHLHFSIIVHDIFVNPIEWWDASWIKNNITDKIENVESGIE